MTILSFIIYLTLYILFLISLIVYTIYWYRKNNIILSIDELHDSIIRNKKIRGRFHKKSGQFFTILQWDFFGYRIAKTKYSMINYDTYKDFIVTAEGLPLISPTKVLNVAKDYNGLYTPYKIPVDLPSFKSINNIRIVKIRKIRKELWEATENTSHAEIIYKLVLPVAATILAICCLIFFPRIYETIMQHSGNALESASSQWFDKITEFMKPLG